LVVRSIGWLLSSRSWLAQATELEAALRLLSRVDSAFDDRQNVADNLRLWRALDPNQKWNVALYNPQAPVNKIHLSDIRKEELSTAISDRTSLTDFKTNRFPGWKVAEFTIKEARFCDIGRCAIQRSAKMSSCTMKRVPTKLPLRPSRKL
jgi:hypothetical protein